MPVKWIDYRFIDDCGYINGNALQAMGRMAGDWYTATTDGNFETSGPSFHH